MNMTAELITKRWSPRAYINRPVDNKLAETLFLAARWAPSSMNEQPWIYYYASREDEVSFNMFLDCLVPGNRVWAKEAGMLILSVALKNFRRNNRPNRHAMHDAGAANTMLALQSASMGLQAHQMGGFDMEKTITTFSLDRALHEPASFIAVGYQGDPSLLPPDLKEREMAPRSRREISDFVTRLS